MHNKVPSATGPGDFTVQAQPVVKSRADVMFAGNAEDCSNSFVESRVIVLFGNPQTAGQVVRLPTVAPPQLRILTNSATRILQR